MISRYRWFDNTSIYLAYFGLKTEQDGSFTLDIDTFKDYYEENQDQFSHFSIAE